MKTIILILVSLSLFATETVEPGTNRLITETIISDKKCIASSVTSIRKSLLDYKSYKDLDDDLLYSLSDFDIPLVSQIPGSGREFLRLIQMTQSRPLQHQDLETIIKDMVQFVFVPMAVNDPSHYPVVYADCTGISDQKDDPTSFTQDCKMIETATRSDGVVVKLKHFTFEDFAIHIDVTAKDTRCEENESWMDYKVTIRTYKDEISILKKDITRSNALVRKFADAIFEEAAFFGAYYKKFFKIWQEKL